MFDSICAESVYFIPNPVVRLRKAAFSANRLQFPLLPQGAEVSRASHGWKGRRTGVSRRRCVSQLGQLQLTSVDPPNCSITPQPDPYPPPRTPLNNLVLRPWDPGNTGHPKTS